MNAGGDNDPTHPVTAMLNDQDHKGKEFISSLGIYLTLPTGYTRDQDAWFGYRSPDGTHWLRFEWPQDYDQLMAKLTAGIDAGEAVIWSNGQTEQIPPDRTAFASKVISKTTEMDTEYRYHVACPGGARGTFLATLVIAPENAGSFDQAKQQLLATVASLEIPTQEQINAERAAKMAEVRSKPRSGEEAEWIEALRCKALVKMGGGNSRSSQGTSFESSTQRFDLCSNGQGSYLYRAHTYISGEINAVGYDPYETGTLSSDSKEEIKGTWTIERDDDGINLVIYDAGGKPTYWVLSELSQGTVLVGRKSFYIIGPGEENGPQCN